MLYLLQVIVYSALLYVVYLLVLKNRASHSFNRFYLLLCAALPVVVPFIKIPAITSGMPISTRTLNIMLPQVNVIAGNNTTGSSFNWYTILIAVYVLATLAVLAYTIIQYTAFKRFVQGHKCEVVNDIKVLLHTNAGPGSFGNYIFLPGDNIDPQVFDHERAHILLKHSNDILFLRLLRAGFWPNIVLYAITQELKLVHEFQADAYAMKNKESYITTLLNDTFITNRFSLAHTFFYHPLKRRIMMLQKLPLRGSKLRLAILKTSALAFIIVAGIIYLQSCKQQPADHNPEIATSNNTSSSPKITEDGLAILMEEYQRKGREYEANESTMSPAEKEQKLKELDQMKSVIENVQQRNASKISANDTAGMAKIMMQGPPKNAKIYEDAPTMENGQMVYPYVEKMPQAPYNLNQYLATMIKYPETARKKGISGRVIVRFTVDDNGNVVNPVILRGIDTDLDAEALRVVTAMPKWIPGEKDGKKVSVYFTQPISFQLN